MKIYIAGKISGLPPGEVKQKFEGAKKMLHGWGHTPISPLDNGCDSECWAEQMMACLPLLMSCEGIFLLPDWEESQGAIIERTFAQKRDMHIIYQEAQESLDTPKSPTSEPELMRFSDVDIRNIIVEYLYYSERIVNGNESMNFNPWWAINKHIFIKP